MSEPTQPVAEALTDSDKLRVLATWFDHFDDWREATGKIAPGIAEYREVQDDLRRIADTLDAARSQPIADTTRLPGESPCRFVAGLDGWSNCVAHGWTGYKDQRRRVLVCPDAYAAPIADTTAPRALGELLAAAQEVVDQLAARYDDQWATGPVLLPDLDELRRAIGAAGEGRGSDRDGGLASELLDAVKGVLEFERLNSVISGPYDRMLNAYNAVIREANRARLSPDTRQEDGA